MLKFNSLLLLPLLAGCPPAGDTGFTDTGECSSGVEWTSGNEESPNMNPGQACIACHASGEGPEFTIAGTVMGDFADPDNCYGVEGMTVRITDADGVVTEILRDGDMYAPVVRFRLPQGETVEVKDLGSGAPDFSTGDAVAVLYLPESPQDFRLDTFERLWLVPIIVMMVVFGGLVILTKGSAVAPFIYTIF